MIYKIAEKKCQTQETVEDNYSIEVFKDKYVNLFMQ